jgi:hypothetical protein
MHAPISVIVWSNRAAVLAGPLLGVEGKEIVVADTLQVIDHPGRRIGVELVLPWTEIMVEEGKPK